MHTVDTPSEKSKKATGIEFAPCHISHHFDRIKAVCGTDQIDYINVKEKVTPVGRLILVVIDQKIIHIVQHIVVCLKDSLLVDFKIGLGNSNILICVMIYHGQVYQRPLTSISKY